MVGGWSGRWGNAGTASGGWVVGWVGQSKVCGADPACDLKGSLWVDVQRMWGGGTATACSSDALVKLGRR